MINMAFNIDMINIASSFKYRLMFFCGAAVHLCFLIMFLNIGVIELAVVNIFSVLTYVLGSIFSVSKSTGTMRYGWMIEFFSEIIIHTVLCILLIGLDTDFYLYLMVILPISIYVLYFTCKIELFFKTICIFIFIAMFFGVGSIIIVQSVEGFPIFPLSYDDIDSFRMINMIAAAIMLIGFSMLFVMEVHTLVRNLGETNRKLEYIATHDKLTGLYNRHSIKAMYENIAVGEEPYCLILGDVDNFKRINDTYGHDCGDEVLSTVADIICKGVGEKGVVCRWGGEEILIIMIGDKASCIACMEEIRLGIAAAKLAHYGDDVCVTMTFGLAYRDEAESMDTLVSLIDKRLYSGKTSGKNRIVSD